MANYKYDEKYFNESSIIKGGNNDPASVFL